MNVQVDYELEGVGILVTMKGHLNMAEYTKQLKRIHTIDTLTTLRYKITDLSGVDSIETDSEEMHDLAKFSDQVSEFADGFFHIIVAKNPLMVSYVNFWRSALKHEKIKVKVVDSLAQAYEQRDLFMDEIRHEKKPETDAAFLKSTELFKRNLQNHKHIQKEIRQTLQRTQQVTKALFPNTEITTDKESA